MSKVQSVSDPRRLLLLVMGFVIWSVAFVALYGVNAIGCAFGWPSMVQRAILLGLLGIHAIVLIGLTLWCRKRWLARQATQEPVPMLEYVGFGLTAAALASTLFSLAPTAFVTMCV